MPVPTTPKAPPRVLLRDLVYDRLLKGIVDGVLIPGEVLREPEIERWTGASRTPVREAIDRLAILGLIEVLPQRETRVATIDLGRFAEQLETIGALYEATVLEGLPLLSAQRIGQLKSATTALPRKGADLRQVISLLDIPMAAYGNQVILQSRNALLPHIEWTLNLSVKDGSLAMPKSDITAFLDAARKGNGRAGAAIVEEYFASAVARTRSGNLEESS
jgi:DNA-binding GntR family transcriptional regulator